MSSSNGTAPAAEQALALAREALSGRETAADLEESQVQALFQAAVLLYCEQHEAGRRFPPVADAEALTATHAAIAALALLETASVEIFELGMWKAWGGA